MNLNELFQGIVVIIDDEIDKFGLGGKETINILAEDLEKNNMPVLPYRSIPSEEDIPALAGASMIVLDWKFDSLIDEESSEERVMGSVEVDKDIREKLFTFIEKALEQLFIPVFILSMESKEGIENSLKSRFPSKNIQERIFVLEKDKCKSYESLTDCITKWLKKMPSVYACKEWEKISLKKKNDMFNELYSYSPSWPIIMWKTIMKDVNNDNKTTQDEFGSFLTRSFSNRMGEYSFDETSLKSEEDPDPEELKKVMQGERFIPYNPKELPKVLCTGDLFRFDKTNNNGEEEIEYWLNITAQCSTIRSKRLDTMYYIIGKPCKNPSFLHFEEPGVYYGDDLKVSYSQLTEKSYRDELNDLVDKIHNDHFIVSGKILGKKSEAYVACVDMQSILVFDLEKVYTLREPDDECFSILTKTSNSFMKSLNEEEKDTVKKVIDSLDSNRKNQWNIYSKDILSKRVGRLLPPYITEIQKATVAYMIRDGQMRLPEELFD